MQNAPQPPRSKVRSMRRSLPFARRSSATSCSRPTCREIRRLNLMWSLHHKKPLYIRLFLLLWLASTSIAHAQLKIEITGFGSSQLPIAIAPLKGEEALPQKVTEVVAADLARSGFFKIIDSGGMNPLP